MILDQKNCFGLRPFGVASSKF